MISRRRVLCITVVLTALLAGRGQTSPPHGPAKDDYSQEAAVIEQMATKIAFDNDGKFNREQTSRVRVQTDSGVKQWGLLSFPFQSATQTVEIDYVRVHKADGTTLITPPDNVQDLDSEIARSGGVLGNAGLGESAYVEPGTGGTLFAVIVEANAGRGGGGSPMSSVQTYSPEPARHPDVSHGDIPHADNGRIGADSI
jgi:hypothetical protein